MKEKLVSLSLMSEVCQNIVSEHHSTVMPHICTLKTSGSIPTFDLKKKTQQMNEQSLSSFWA